MPKQLLPAMPALLLWAASAWGAQTVPLPQRQIVHQDYRWLQTLKGFYVEIMCVAWSPDSQKVAAGGRKTAVFIWSADNGEVVARLNDDTMPETHCVTFSSDGKMLAAGGLHGQVRIWDVAEQKVLKSLDCTYGGKVGGVEFSPDGKKLAVTTKGLLIWDVNAGTIDYKIPEDIWSVAWNRTGKGIVTAGAMGVRLIEPATGKVVKEFNSEGYETSVVAFSPNSRSIASAYQDGRVCLWDSITGQRHYKFIDNRSSVLRLDFSSDAYLLFSASRWEAYVRDLGTGTIIGKVPPEIMEWFRDARMSPNGMSIALVKHDKTIAILKQ
jgi:WD40 repeat protein